MFFTALSVPLLWFARALLHTTCVSALDCSGFTAQTLLSRCFGREFPGRARSRALRNNTGMCQRDGLGKNSAPMSHALRAATSGRGQREAPHQSGQDGLAGSTGVRRCVRAACEAGQGGRRRCCR